MKVVTAGTTPKNNSNDTQHDLFTIFPFIVLLFYSVDECSVLFSSEGAACNTKTK
jgi:hypothetical protein